jgi:hypothetical protein
MRHHIPFPVLLIAFVSTTVFAQGVHTWYGNDVFMRELDQSIAAFFGDSVGTYVPVDEYGKLRPAQQTEKAKIGNQFLSVFGHGGPGMHTLPDGNTLYEYFAPHDGQLRVAIVTPKYDTSILAAAVTHWTCGSLPAADIHDAAAVEANYQCNKPTVTVFFKDQASVNSVIRSELVKWGMSIWLPSCETDILHNTKSLEHKIYVARYGKQPPSCHARYKVLTLNP